MTFVRTPPSKLPSFASFSENDQDRVAHIDTSPSTTDDALDELAALFLTPADRQEKSQQPSTAVSSMIELLVPGHLPVRGNLWLAPYADAIARKSGCTTLMRMDSEDDFSFQTICCAESSGVYAGASVQEVVQAFAPQTRNWMIRPAIPLRFDEIIASGADRLTILTSTEGIAVVAAFQLIKGLAEAAREAGVPLPRLGVAVVGAEENAAREMVRRLNLTASSTLEAEIELRLCLPRMDAGVKGSQHITFSGEPCPAIGEVIQWIKQVRPQPMHRSDIPQVSQTTTQQPAMEPAAPRRNGHHEPTATSAVSLKLSPKARGASSQVLNTSSESSADSSLTKHIAGLTLIKPRCPGHESIELAVDDAGIMHLVGRESDLRDLHKVKAWAISHNQLIAMACRDQTVQTNGEPVCHVVTATPASVVDLHGTDLRLHVLAEVNVNGRTAWYAAPLN